MGARPENESGPPARCRSTILTQAGKLYCAAACLHQQAFSDTSQAYDDGYYVRDGDVVLALGVHGVD